MEKRLFFALEIFAPWPEKWPSGRVLDKNARHLTLAFLGKIESDKIEKILSQFPVPNFKIARVGQFDKPLFLPLRKPKVVAWNIDWFGKGKEIFSFERKMLSWLHSHGFAPDSKNKKFLPHVTVCRKPFISKDWKKAFASLPLIAKDIHLYESLGHSKYKVLWTYSLIAPFTSIEHTGDLAFLVKGKDLLEVLLHAKVALAFEFPPLLDFFHMPEKIESLDEIIVDLNELILRADSEIGCPFKAVSWHGEIREIDNIYEWEMVVDV